jgi:hypothetical protein
MTSPDEVPVITSMLFIALEFQLTSWHKGCDFVNSTFIKGSCFWLLVSDKSTHEIDLPTLAHKKISFGARSFKRLTRLSWITDLDMKDELFLAKLFLGFFLTPVLPPVDKRVLELFVIVKGGGALSLRVSGVPNDPE